jgi:uncharacterized protein
MHMLPITLTIAGAAALLNIWLGLRVSALRRQFRVSVETRMRAHANFTEYTPFFLILLGLIELAKGSPSWLWLVAILFILGRLLHPFGMDRPAPNALRMIGTILTWGTMIGLAAYAITLPYFTPKPTSSIGIAASDAATPAS